MSRYPIHDTVFGSGLAMDYGTSEGARKRGKGGKSEVMNVNPEWAKKVAAYKDPNYGKPGWSGGAAQSNVTVSPASGGRSRITSHDTVFGEDYGTSEGARKRGQGGGDPRHKPMGSTTHSTRAAAQAHVDELHGRGHVNASYSNYKGGFRVSHGKPGEADLGGGYRR